MEDLAGLTILAVAVALGTAGLVKGLAGIGLPLIAIPGMALSIDLALAVALIPVSLVITNVWQIVSNRHIGAALRRFWPMLLVAPIGAVIGVKFLAEADPKVLSAIVGVAIVVSALLMQFRTRWRVPEQLERFVGLAASFAAGLLGGVTAIFSPPLVLFLASIKIDKEVFVGAIGVLLLFGTAPMVVALAGFGVLNAEGFMWSALAAAPVLAGQLLGQRLRRLIQDKPFRLMILILLLASGLNLIRQAIF